jgi:hypothetical protein
MSTVPVALSPGFRFGAVRTALAAAPLPRLLSMLSVPAVKVLAGFAALAVKFAPDPTVMPTAARTTASAPTVRRGCAARADRRDTGCSSEGGGKRDTAAGVASLARTPSALQPGGAGDKSLFGTSGRELECKFAATLGLQQFLRSEPARRA